MPRRCSSPSSAEGFARRVVVLDGRVHGGLDPEPALVEHGSFAAAAEHLHRTHPTVHAALTALESQLGIVLLDRSGYRVALTAEGAALHARVLGFAHPASGRRVRFEAPVPEDFREALQSLSV